MRIRSIRLSGLRGISGPFTLNLSKGGTGEARSVLLFGENGSGKSSVVDGIEFALRGVVSRRSEYGKKDRREIRQLFPQKMNPQATLAFDTGLMVSRGAVVAEKDHHKYLGKEVVPGFDKSPLVIRRRDIDGFWSTPADVRQSAFFDYLRPPGGDFLDEKKRAEALGRYRLAQTAYEEALQEAKSLVPDWGRPWPVRPKGIDAMRRELRISTNRERKRHPDLNAAVTLLESALAEKNHASTAAKPALALEAVDRSPLQEIFKTVAQRVTSDFLAVTGEAWISDIDFDMSNESSMAISLVTEAGSLDPTQVLSEAMLDLLALLIFVEVHIECARRGQERIIILDDVFQSVDRSLRMRTLEHLARRLEGWQIILTLHDRLWLELAGRALTAAGNNHINVEIRRSQMDGSCFVLEPLTGVMSDLLWSVENGASPTLIASAAGRALEASLEEATQHLGISVRRNVGDHFTINDLWQPLYSDLKSVECSKVKDIAAAIESHRFIRNIIGAHYSEHSQGISATEMEDFANLVIKFRQSMTCSKCGLHYKKGPKKNGVWPLSPSCKHPIAS